MLIETNPFNAVKEDFSLSYITQLTADSGVSYEEDRKDYIAVDGQVNFAEIPLRIQLKSTVQPTKWAPSFTYYLEEDWLRKWCNSKIPVVLVLLVIDCKTDTNGERLPFISHDTDDYKINGRGYWIRVDDLAKAHDFKTTKGLSITLNSTHRIGSKTVLDWHKVAMSIF